MATLTFQILEGMERGHTLSGLQPPITIGREEDNGVQLNDERVSRFHAKIQEDDGKIILTDLESTNGTRVNGHPVQMHVLRIGDQVSIGRCLLLYGSREEIEEQIQLRRGGLHEAEGGTVTFDSDEIHQSGSSLDSEELPRMFPDGAPPLPSGLRPVQVAQLSDALAHVHDCLRSVIERGRSEEGSGQDDPPFEVDWVDWQKLLQVEMELSQYIASVTDPDGGGDA